MNNMTIGKTKYKSINFVESENQDLIYAGRKGWEIKNNRTKSLLGYIFWFTKWGEYCFTQADSGVIFNDGCSKDIVDFMGQLKILTPTRDK